MKVKHTSAVIRSFRQVGRLESKVRQVEGNVGRYWREGTGEPQEKEEKGGGQGYSKFCRGILWG